MHARIKQQSRTQGGFTLIELMVTLVIATVLIIIAVPTYQSQIRKSRRTEAKTALLDLAGREERLFAVNNAYSGSATALGYSGGSFPLDVGSGYYRVTMPVQTATTFTFTATALTTDQLKDTTCRTFTVTHLGVQSAANSSSVDTTATCWR